jgi:hypothetical protein
MDMDCRLAWSLVGECWLRGFGPAKGGSVLLFCPEVSMSADRESFRMLESHVDSRIMEDVV